MANPHSNSKSKTSESTPTQENKIYLQIVERVSSSSPGLDLDKIKKAYEFAKLAHTSQKRLSGEPFINHVLAVALTLSSWKLDTDSIVSGLLHDTVEDGGATRDDLVNEFGEGIAQIVDGVTKIGKIHLKGSSEEQFVENLRKMLLVMARDLRVILVKLADRLHNMQTLEFLPPDKQLIKAKETLEIYAPLAERLGIGEIKGQLEDLAFPFAYPNDYTWLKTYSAPFYKSAQAYLDKVKRSLFTAFSKSELKNITINARSKHLYSLYRKLLRPEHARDITKVHDLSALRILTSSVEDCYVALGLIHKIYRPVPYLGIRDFIANPKPNGYRSIHTNVFGPDGKIIEIQIRTYEMHEEAEMGVAAHWQYAQAKSSGVKDEALESGISVPRDKLDWVKQLVSWQKEITDSEEFLNALKFDALSHRNLVFSPKGDVYDLPRDATPIDFAYKVHTKLGHQASGARVNGKLVSLDHKLINGDVVEILTDRNKKQPSRDWLNFVITRSARHQITKALKLSH